MQDKYNNYSENNSEIIFRHKITLEDLIGKYLYSLNLLIIPLSILLSIGFYSPIAIKSAFSSSIFIPAILLSIIFILLDIVMTIFYTNAKIVMTEDKIYYKPPFYNKIYTMDTDKIDFYSQNAFLLSIYGKNPEQHFKILLSEKHSENLIRLLKNKIPNIKNKTYNLKIHNLYKKFYITVLLITSISTFLTYPIFLSIKEKIGDYYYLEWIKSDFKQEIYRQNAEKNYKIAALNERNYSYEKKYKNLINKKHR